MGWVNLLAELCVNEKSVNFAPELLQGLLKRSNTFEEELQGRKPIYERDEKSGNRRIARQSENH